MTIQEAQGYSDITHPHYLVYQSQNKYLLILVRTSYPHKYIQQTTSHYNSAIGTMVGPNLTIHMIYQHPKSNKAQFQEMWDILSTHYQNDNIIAIGDFNAAHPTWSPQGNGNLLGQWLYNSIQKYKWVIANNIYCQNTATYRCKSRNTLDLAITSSTEVIKNMEVLQQSVLVSDQDHSQQPRPGTSHQDKTQMDNPRTHIGEVEAICDTSGTETNRGKRSQEL